MFVLLMTPDPLDMISNFVSLVIISEFDSMVYASMKGEPAKSLVEKRFTEEVLIWKHTSSLKATKKELSDVVDE